MLFASCSQAVLHRGTQLHLSLLSMEIADRKSSDCSVLHMSLRKGGIYASLYKSGYIICISHILEAYIYPFVSTVS